MFNILNEFQNNRILILNYNTFIIQSTGFLHYMSQKLGVQHVLSDLPEFDFLRIVLQYADKNTGKIVDEDIDWNFYKAFITDKFKEITDMSSASSTAQLIRILMMQQFVETIHIASPAEFNHTQDIGDNPLDIFDDQIIYTTFDIFDTETVVQYIKDHQINTVWLADSEMLHEIVFRDDIKHSEMTYIMSKIGYTMSMVEEAYYLKHPVIMDKRIELNFNFGIIDLISPPVEPMGGEFGDLTMEEE